MKRERRKPAPKGIPGLAARKKTRDTAAERIFGFGRGATREQIRPAGRDDRGATKHKAKKTSARRVTSQTGRLGQLRLVGEDGSQVLLRVAIVRIDF